MSNSGWCLTGELAPKAAERFEIDVEQFADNAGTFPPTVSRFEQPGEELWQVDVYFVDRPEPVFLSALLDHAGLPDWHYKIGPIEDRDWVTESQKLLSPVRAGRFLVFGSHDADKADTDLINLQIDAGQAFGTGKHETTAACLSLLDQLADTVEPKSVLDIGTGSAVLALAAAKVWPAASITATDIDPIAIEVSVENCAVNKVATRKITSKDPAIALVVADGLNDPLLTEEQPYSVAFANILAGPLINMAPSISNSVVRGGHLILSGLLITQKQDVLEAYQRCGMTIETECLSGEWAALQLRKS